MSYAVGYGHEVWSAGGYYFWIPMVAPFLGCAFGGFLYDVFIYKGPSPINSPWLGLKLLTPGNAMCVRREHLKREKKELCDMLLYQSFEEIVISKTIHVRYDSRVSM
ncbi:hypothetical protein GGP41_001531 [Bipolaris sorokiniana]|uniref:Uncharacterized protein n=1 Tax=Cochliobolus sativus TaxID=45130 RepID=A0A8H6DZ37_COCSA|nr:hypothetical protein GGP41_001531 [Bipolaris sorokiniana]